MVGAHAVIMAWLTATVADNTSTSMLSPPNRLVLYRTTPAA